jgi:hypothetical protein
MEDRTVAERVIKAVIDDVFPLLNETTKRIAAGSMAKGYGRGGVAIVNQLSGVSRNTITKGKDQAEVTAAVQRSEAGRIRKPGGGRKKETEKNPEIVPYIRNLLEESTYGDPERVIVYTSLSHRKIAEKVKENLGVDISRNIVGDVIESLDYSKQKNKKLQQVTGLNVDPDERDRQFRHINETSKQYLKDSLPVISIDCKKKEVLGNLANIGKEYRLKGDPRPVNDHDFEDKDLGKVAPYGVLVLNNNTAFVNLGVSNDTAEFAVQSIRIWWYDIGVHTFPNARKIYITADGGGSNGSRSRLFKVELAKLAQETGLEIEVSHFPPGTSKWNKVEHQLFAYISRSWEGKPLTDIETVIKLIGSTTTTKGLKVVCKEDPRSYEKGIRISDEQLNQIDIEYPDPANKWNYVIKGFRSIEEAIQPARRKRGRPRKN